VGAVSEFAFDTERLILRAWRDADIDPFQRICSDPQVMATLGPPLDRPATVKLIERMRASQAQWGHCFWAVEDRADGDLIGWCGLIRGTAGPIADKLEIGWRLAGDRWGRGYATEAAKATLAWALAHLADDAVWAITAQTNSRSRAVMERLGMAYCRDSDFDHPSIAPGDPLRRHVLYRIDRA
jgi:RimJ/RimL family protein N-acetyltransferase